MRQPDLAVAGAAWRPYREDRSSDSKTSYAPRRAGNVEGNNGSTGRVGRRRAAEAGWRVAQVQATHRRDRGRRKPIEKRLDELQPKARTMHGIAQPPQVLSCFEGLRPTPTPHHRPPGQRHRCLSWLSNGRTCRRRATCRRSEDPHRRGRSCLALLTRWQKRHPAPVDRTAGTSHRRP